MNKGFGLALLIFGLAGAAGAYLVYDETTGLGQAPRPPQGIPKTPQQLGHPPLRQRGIFPDEPARPQPSSPPSGATARTAPPEPVTEELELDDMGDWQHHEMEPVAPGGAPGSRAPAAPPPEHHPGQPRFGPEKKFDSKDTR